MAEPNGAPRWRDLERIEHRIKNSEAAFTHIGSRVNDHDRKLDVHGEKFEEHERRLDDIEEKAMKVPILEVQVLAVITELRNAKQALWAVAGSFLVLAGTIVWQALQ